MKIPKRLNIAGHFYQCRLARPNELPAGAIGCLVVEDKLILLDRDLRGEALLRTLLHEIKHAHQIETGLTQMLDAQGREFDAEGFSSLLVGLFHLRFK